MSTPLVLAFIWIILTNFIAILPSKDHHWRAAYILIAIGLPIGAWVFWRHGFWIGSGVFIAGASMLHWPIRFAWRWVKQKLRGEGDES